MKRLLLLLLIPFLTVSALPAPVQAQDDEEGTRLEQLIEGALSSDGMSVTVRGFRGALSSQATMDLLTIADENGVWLTLEDAELDWSRTALLTGRVEVEQLTAQRLELSRLPASDTEAPAPEAGGMSFSLPDLPVSVNVGEFAIERVELGAPVVGEELALNVAGTAQLADGEGEVELSVQRIDGPRDAVTLQASYANDTRQLDIDLALDGARGGLIATRAALPGDPSIRFTVQGSGPVDDFTADVALATDNTDRLTGEITLETMQELGHRFAANLSGDLRPLVEEDRRAFLGAQQTLQISGITEKSGALELDTLDLQTSAVSLTGNARIGADGWPERLALDGRIASDDGEPVQMAFTSDPTLIDEATLTLSYDAAEDLGKQS